MPDNEEKKEEGRRPQEGTQKKSRRVEGPTAIALEALVTLLAVFASDLMNEEVSVQDAASYLDENLAVYIRKYVRTNG